MVRTRRYVKKFMLMRANIQAVSLKIQTLKSQNAMAQAMKGVTKAMGSMNKQMKLPEIQKIMMEFEKQSEIMDMKEEMMADTIGKNSHFSPISYLYYLEVRFHSFTSFIFSDDAMGDEDDEEESDAIVNQVLDELGLQLTDGLAAVPGVPAGSVTVGDKNKKTAVAAGGPGGGGGGAAAAGADGGEATDADADLQARLDDLRRE